MLDNIIEKQYIKLSSPVYIIKSWKLIDNKVWKPTAEKWKDLLPGDCITFETILDFNPNKIVVKAYRNSDLIWSDIKTPKQLVNLMNHFNII